jgi:hypothetical protein
LQSCITSLAHNSSGSAGLLVNEATLKIVPLIFALSHFLYT